MTHLVSTKVFQLGSTCFTVTGQSYFLNQFEFLFPVIKDHVNMSPLFEIEEAFEPLLQSKDGAIQGGRLTLSHNGFTDSNSFFDIRIEMSKKFKILLYFKQQNIWELLKSYLITGSTDSKALSWDYFFSYSYFFSLLQFALVPNGLSFLHAGVVERAGKCFIFAGTGGSGKSTLTHCFVNQCGFRYLAEDFSLISSNAKAYYSPRPIAFYYSDYIKSSVELKKNFNRLLKKNTLNYISWLLNFVLRRNPLRRVSPTNLYGQDKIAIEGMVSSGFFVSRACCHNVKIQETSVDEFVQRSISASLREMIPLYEYYYQLLANTDVCFFDMKNIESQMKAVYTKAFQNKRLYKLTVPKECDPSIVANLILESTK